MVKPRVAFLLLVVLVIIAFGGMFLFYSLKDQEPLQVFPATVNRDCAPWDGAAFTVSVQYDPGTVIFISIWQSPDIPYRSTFSFPDKSGREGNAFLAPALTSYIELDGKVTFQSVSVDKPVGGRFSFTSERGEAFEGSFIAEWQNEVVFCG